MKKIDVKNVNKISKEMIKEATNLGLSVRKTTESLFTLSNDAGKKIMFMGSMPETNSAVAYRLTNDKYFTYKFLKANNFPVLDMVRYNEECDAEGFMNRYKKIVVKPREGMHGKGITVGVETTGDLEKAIKCARENDPRGRILLEEYFDGTDCRILVIGKEKVFAISRIPAFVVGDGKRKIDDLIDEFNENASDYQYPIEKDLLTRNVLKAKGFYLDSVPGKGVEVKLRETANVKSGGLAVDMTGKVNEEVIEKAKNICRLLDLDIAGIDWMSPDLSSNRGKFIEINAYPGILLHKYPSKGKSRNVARELLNYLFFSDNT